MQCDIQRVYPPTDASLASLVYQVSIVSFVGHSHRLLDDPRRRRADASVYRFDRRVTVG